MELETRARVERTVASVFVIKLDGEFDLAECDRLKDAFAVANTSPIVVVNLQKTGYIDSCVLKCLVELRAATQNRGASLILVGLSATVRRLFEVTGLDEIFDIRSSLGEISGLNVARRLTIEARPLARAPKMTASP